MLVHECLAMSDERLVGLPVFGSSSPGDQAGRSSASGTASAAAATHQYSTMTSEPAGIHLYVGVSNRRARSTIARRVSGNGDTPNSIPRVRVFERHGACERLRFSSQMPSHGKSTRRQT